MPNIYNDLADLNPSALVASQEILLPSKAGEQFYMDNEFGAGEMASFTEIRGFEMVYVIPRNTAKGFSLDRVTYVDNPVDETIFLDQQAEVAHGLRPTQGPVFYGATAVPECYVTDEAAYLAMDCGKHVLAAFVLYATTTETLVNMHTGSVLMSTVYQEAIENCIDDYVELLAEGGEQLSSYENGVLAVIEKKRTAYARTVFSQCKADLFPLHQRDRVREGSRLALPRQPLRQRERPLAIQRAKSWRRRNEHS